MQRESKYEANPHFIDYFRSQERFAILVGGAGSGKSVAAVQKHLSRISTEYNQRFLFARKWKEHVRHSIHELTKDIANDYQMACKPRDLDLRFPEHNSEILMVGLDDVDKMKSIANVTGIFLEEGDQFEEYDIDQLNLRLRGETENYKQITIALNPVDETHFIKPKFVDEDRPDVYYNHSTYQDNPKLDAEYIEQLETNFIHDENLERIYVHGLWGVVRSGLEYYHQFNFNTHVRTCEYIPGYPIHMTQDFNVVPYLATLLFQLIPKEGRMEWRCFAEYAMKPPRSTVEDSAEAVLDDYENQIKESGIFYYADPSGRSRMPLKQNTNLIKEVQNSMRGYLGPQNMRVEKRAKPHQDQPDRSIGRNSLMNKILRGADKRVPVDIVIDPSCKLFIKDLQKVQSGLNNEKVKNRVRDKRTGGTYEELGHFSDAFDYFAVSIVNTYYRLK